MTKNEKKTGKKLVILAAIVCLLMLGGSMAWLTSRSDLTNTFTVGEINPIDPGKGEIGPDGNHPIDPNDDSKLKGNLYEPNWTKDSKLMPGAIIPKDPYVGVGKKSEASYVYIFVKNTMKNDGKDIYFEINKGWEAVADSNTNPISQEPGDSNKFTGGLFRYNKGLAGADEGNTWTERPLFSNIIISDAASSDDFKDVNGKVGVIEVSSFLHQKSDGQNGTINQSVADKAAIDLFVTKQ